MFEIAGLVPLSTLDWPGQLSAVLFMQGCRWKCGYCHNSHLRGLKKSCSEEANAESASCWLRINDFLSRRVGLLDAVVISGGEPTLHANLQELILKIKSFGFKVGLHTGGYDPQNFAKVLPFLDWVGLDYKTCLADYRSITKDPQSGEKFKSSLLSLIHAKIPYEIRTTVFSKYHNQTKLLEMAEELHGYNVDNYFLQEYRAVGNLAKESGVNESPLRDILSQTAQQEMSLLFKNFSIRWVNQ